MVYWSQCGDAWRVQTTPVLPDYSDERRGKGHTVAEDLSFPKRAKYLFGREPDIIHLLNRAQAPGLTAVVGPPRMGKTWLLEEVARRLTTDAGCLVGYHESKSTSADLFLRTVVDLYTRWLADAGMREQAHAMWKKHKGDFFGTAATAFGEILTSLGGAGPPGKVGEVIGKALGALVKENAQFKAGWVTLQPLDYDQARDLVKLVAQVSKRPIVLILDAWEQSPSLDFEFQMLKSFLSNVKDWRQCHIFVGICRPDPRKLERLDAAYNYATELEIRIPRARIHPLDTMHLDDEGERNRVIAHVRDLSPAAEEVRDDGALIDLIGGFPGVLERWRYVRDRMSDLRDLEREARDARQNRYPEFRYLIPALPSDERSFAMRLALFPRLGAETWPIYRDVLLDGLSEELLYDLNAKALLAGEDYPSYGHETRHAAALECLTSQKPYRPQLKDEAEGIISRLAGRVGSISQDARPFLEALRAMQDAGHYLGLSDAARALIEAAMYLFPGAALLDSDLLDRGAQPALDRHPSAAFLITAALVNRGNAKGEAGDMPGAIADYNAVLEMPEATAQQKASALVNRGAAKLQDGDTVGAIADCTAVLNTPEASAEQKAMAQVNRGGAKLQAGDTARAIDDVTAVLEMPDAPAEQKAKALVNRGLAKGQAGDTAGEIDDYTAVLEMPEASAEVKEKARALLRAVKEVLEEGSGTGE